ncbi:MAG: carbon starvation protein A [Bifidobacteriaceae bacterium]|jgi:carbon starvation protein|nr:carbon starvation protein A [Bifidobacteriaceae bacterium]
MAQTLKPARHANRERVGRILRNSRGRPVGINFRDNWTPAKIVLWVMIALAGAVGWTMLAVARGERVNAVWFVVTAVATYMIGYRFYALYIQRRILHPDDTRATPAERINNGLDYDPTDRRVLFGHHFAGISGAGPLVGPVLSAQMGYLPGTLWIIFGVLAAGAVQDMAILFFSMRRGGRSLGQMARDEMGRFGGTVATVIVWVMVMIVLAVLSLICVNALAESPWAVFSVGCTIPIALLMGLYLRYVRPGRVTEVSLIGFLLLIGAIIGGRYVAASEWGGQVFHLSHVQLVWAMVIYGFCAAVLPVWLLLTPRDYLSTFMKIGTITVLAVGIVVVQPLVQMPAVTEFATNTDGPVFAGALFPFLFITIACGALSGTHATICSGTTPKMIQKESQVRMIGYGGMLMESFVAIMALAAAVSLNIGVYFSMNMSPATIEKLAAPVIEAEYSPADAAALSPADKAAIAVGQLGITTNGGTSPEVEWTVDQANGSVTLSGGEALETIARDVGEENVVSRTGGAPTLAVGMANILHNIFGGRDMMAFWYHFAIMFEALFILSAVDTVTRVCRFQFQDLVGNWSPKLADPSNRPAAWGATAVIAAIWGSLLLMGVTDPLGGVQTLYPLFGIANQLIAAAALTVATVIVVNKGYVKWVWITVLPLAWDVAVTFTASYQKIFSPKPELGYWAMWQSKRDQIAAGGLDAGSLTAAQAVVRNSFIQGTLSIIFVVMITVLMVCALIQIVRALRGEPRNSEDPHVESDLFAPANFLARPLERTVQAEVAAAAAGGGAGRGGGAGVGFTGAAATNADAAGPADNSAAGVPDGRQP